MKKVLRSVGEKLKRLPSWIALMLITFYQACISPHFPACCRFRPTCSEYAREAVKKYGFRKGTALTAKRLIKCRPGGPSGYDPVP